MRDTKLALQALSEKVKNLKSYEETIRILIKEKDCMEQKLVVLERRVQNTTDHTKKMEKEWKKTICTVSQLERNAQEARPVGLKKEDASEKYGHSKPSSEAADRKDKIMRQKECMRKKMSLLEQRIQSTTQQPRRIENKWQNANGSISQLKLNTENPGLYHRKGQDDLKILDRLISDSKKNKEERPKILESLTSMNDRTSLPFDSMIDSKEMKGYAGSSDNGSFDIYRDARINNVDSKQTEILQYPSKASNCKTTSKRCKNLNEAEENASCDELPEISTFGKHYASWICNQLSSGGLEDTLSFSDSESFRDASNDKKLELQCLLNSVDSAVHLYPQQPPFSLKREGNNFSGYSSSEEEKSTGLSESIVFRPNVMGKRSSMDRRSSANITLRALSLIARRRHRVETDQ